MYSCNVLLIHYTHISNPRYCIPEGNILLLSFMYSSAFKLHCSPLGGAVGIEPASQPHVLTHFYSKKLVFALKLPYLIHHTFTAKVVIFLFIIGSPDLS